MAYRLQPPRDPAWHKWWKKFNKWKRMNSSGFSTTVGVKKQFERITLGSFKKKKKKKIHEHFSLFFDTLLSKRFIDQMWKND